MNIIEEIRETQKTFVIAEIGQNHQGNLETAKKLIKVAKECGVDCVKFQKTCLEEKFTKSALEVPYSGPNSWGETYGAHKKYLEFSEEQFLDLQKFAKELGILFTASAMDEKSLEFLASIKVPFIKIGSGDSNNLLMIEKAAKTAIPLIISTGMIGFDGTQEIYNLVSKYHKNFALLHCVSSYPTPYEDINLKVVQQMKRTFPDIVIGYSGHELDIHITLCAVAIGAKVIERHITLDKTQKGSDHKCSLEPKQLKTLIDHIRSLEKALGEPVKKMQESEKLCYEKLGKSLVYAGEFETGHKVGEEDLKIKVSVPKGLDGSLYRDVMGKVLGVHVNADDPVKNEDFW